MRVAGQGAAGECSSRPFLLPPCLLPLLVSRPQFGSQWTVSSPADLGHQCTPPSSKPIPAGLDQLTAADSNALSGADKARRRIIFHFQQIVFQMQKLNKKISNNLKRITLTIDLTLQS